ncbi:putative ribosomal N-acetyltransferase YdaF [Abditibacteriota bacterium]|nr:putative ribosomal N-acetyltransferase YdaF [Abditibacteriota bacterium]
MTARERAMIRDFPLQLVSRRLEYRAPTPGDADFIHPAILASHSHLQPWMRWAKHTPTLDDTKLYVRRALWEWHDRESLDYRLFWDGQFVGNCAIHTIQWEVPSAQIGYWLHAEFYGRGFITEAVERLEQFAWEELDLARLEIRCHAGNVASAKVAVRAGFEQEAHMRNSFRDNSGNLSDALIFAKTRVPRSESR